MTDSDEKGTPELVSDPAPEPEPDSDDVDDPVRVNNLFWIEQALRYFIFLELFFPCIACSAYDWAMKMLTPTGFGGLSTEWVMALVMGGAGTFALILSLIGCLISQHVDSRRWFVGGAILGMGWVVLTAVILLVRAYYL